MTEAQEFAEIYKLDILDIPTNKPLAREDLNDVVYKSEKAKYYAVIEDIIERHKTGQPILVGTVSIEKSEIMSKLLKAKGVAHNVLNAKNHEREAEIVAQAGKLNAVTIATNMAGRGTDIMLGGNAEFMAKQTMRKLEYSEELIAEATGFAETDDEEIILARAKFAELNEQYKKEIEPEAEKVRSVGGLCIIGTERHESRRIDNQLRGRAGRQGDPGCSRFYISLEDDLMRLFGGERINAIMESMNFDENQPLEMKMLTKRIETAQQRIELRNFGIRKNVLNFDDVMNTQRTIIYQNRNRVLDGEDLQTSIQNMLRETITSACERYLIGDIDQWNLDGLKEYFKSFMDLGNALDIIDEDRENADAQTVAQNILERAQELYAERENEIGSDKMREIERFVLLRSVDTHWMDHIDAMDELRNGIYLRSYGQHDPVVEYREEGSDMFEAMNEEIREETSQMVMRVRVRKEEEVKREQVAKVTGTSSDGTVNSTVKKGTKVGRNDPCPCGSGKKYKRCCGANEE